MRGFGDGRKNNNLSHYYQNNVSLSPAGSKKSAEKDVRKRGRGRWEELPSSTPPDTIFLIKEGLPRPSGKTQSGLHEPMAFPMTPGRQKASSQYHDVRITGPFQFFTAPLGRGPGWTRAIHQFSK